MTDEVRAALREMLGPDVGLGLSDPREPEQGLFQHELPYIARAVPKRRREFAAGRRAARAAMVELGLPPAPILRGPQREPLWPEDLAGSIAHCDTLCIAAVSRTHRSLGLDIEEATPLDADLEETICTPAERAWLDTLPPRDRGLSAKRIFSAKEALFKAQYPLTGRMIGFGEVELAASGGMRSFCFNLTRLPISKAFRSTNVSLRISGRWILSACHLPTLELKTDTSIA